MRVSPEGGYSGIVVKIQDDVPDDLCKTILSNLEVSLTALIIFKVATTAVKLFAKLFLISSLPVTMLSLSPRD